MPLITRPNIKELLWITLILAILCVVISTTQYSYLVWKTEKADAKDLQVDAQNITAKLQITDSPNLSFFNKAYIDAGPYAAISDDGTVIDIGSGNKGHVPSFFPSVELPWFDSKSLGKVQHYRSPLGEDFRIVTVPIGSGFGVVGLSQYDIAPNPDELLLKNAEYFPHSADALSSFRADNIDNQINWALVGDDGRLVAADGRLPFHVDPLIVGQESAHSGFREGKSGSRYYVLYTNLHKASGETAGVIIGYQDITGETGMLRDIRNFSLSVGAISFVLFFALFIWALLKHEVEKQELRAAFQRYFSPQILEAILREPQRLKESRREVTVMFSDIRSFTGLVEKLPADRLSRMLQEYFDEMTEEVIATEGVVDKFIGDGIMAFWGAPIDQPDQADRAVRAAKGMVKRLERLKAKWSAEGGSVLEIGIAVNYGLATVGNFGSKHRVDYTVIGDVVNVASRLEGLNKDFKSHIIISESTKRQLSGKVSTRDLGLVDIRGHEDKVHIHEVMD